MSGKSLGLIETVGMSAAVEAADAAMKSANVSLVGYEFVSKAASCFLLPFDLHVLGLPPAFNLSHDQTLQFKSFMLKELNFVMNYVFTLETWYSFFVLRR